MMKNNNSCLISAIVAMDENQGIGYQGSMPWHLPADLRQFKAITIDHPIIMGRKTHEAIGKPLPNRTNIIISQKLDYEAPGCLVTDSLEKAITLGCEALSLTQDEIFIIGGGQIYAQAMPRIEKIYLTLIHHQFHTDASFPTLVPEEWQIVKQEKHAADAENPYAFSFMVLTRRKDQGFSQ